MMRGRVNRFSRQQVVMAAHKDGEASEFEIRSGSNGSLLGKDRRRPQNSYVIDNWFDMAVQNIDHNSPSISSLIENIAVKPTKLHSGLWV